VSATFPDKRALRILFGTYWSSRGWKSEGERTLTVADRDYAHAHGVMFEPLVSDHDELVEWLVLARSLVSRQLVADSFVASLTTRRLDLRSALGSYAIGRHFPAHRFPVGEGVLECPVCGDLQWGAEPHDLSVLSFERFKWGGVRHGYPLYIAFDLERLAETPRLEPTAADRAALRRILDVAASMPPDAKPAALELALKKVVGGGEHERRRLIAILGYAGVLQPRELPGFLEGFTAFKHRAEPESHRDLRSYPISRWRGADGVSAEAVGFWFGSS
jgi:hypothetical protein